MSINLLGTTKAPRINLAQKVRNCEFINPMHCPTSLKMVAELWCHQGTFSAICLCLLLLECPTLFHKLRKTLRWQKINSPSVSLKPMADLSLCTGMNFRPTRLRSNETWSTSGFEIRTREFFSTKTFFCSSGSLEGRVRFNDDPSMALKPIGFLPTSENRNKDF